MATRMAFSVWYDSEAGEFDHLVIRTKFARESDLMQADIFNDARHQIELKYGEARDAAFRGYGSVRERDRVIRARKTDKRKHDRFVVDSGNGAAHGER